MVGSGERFPVLELVWRWQTQNSELFCLGRAVKVWFPQRNGWKQYMVQQSTKMAQMQVRWCNQQKVMC